MTKDESKENWVCGDCGTEWTPDVDFCKNKELDLLAVRRYSEGYKDGIKVSGEAVRQLIDAIELLNSFGLSVVKLEKKK